MSDAITVHCPSCETSFPVDPAKVPPEGVRARCSVCEEIFPVEPSAGESGPEEEEEGLEAGGHDVFAEGAGAGGEAATATEAPPEVEAAEPAGPGAEAPRPSFGQRSPEEKAKRLARVLVSDMITYNPDLYEEALEKDTLKEDFEEEIDKSWEEYVEQVGEELADSTDYWNQALNEILAKGDDVF